MGSPLSFFACVGAMNQIGTPLPALSPQGGERVAAGWERGGSWVACSPWSSKPSGRIEDEDENEEEDEETVPSSEQDAAKRTLALIAQKPLLGFSAISGEIYGWQRHRFVNSHQARSSTERTFHEQS